MEPERRFVGDDEILSCGSRALNHVERRHHRGRDSLNRSLRVPGDELVDRFGTPRHSNVLFDSLDNLAGGWLRGPKGES